MIIYGVDVRCHYDNGNVRVAHRYTASTGGYSGTEMSDTFASTAPSAGCEDARLIPQFYSHISMIYRL